MKKSFMTRVLAMGLSFAMAFSLSAATNVTTASAAAKKVGVTTMMKVSTKSVTEGKTVKTYMNSTALKKYRIKKVAKLSAVADKYIDVDVITSGSKNRQGLEITAHDGAVTAAKLTKKGVYVTIYFAETTSPKKAAKATAKKYAKLKVAVNAKPVEKPAVTELSKVTQKKANSFELEFTNNVASPAAVDFVITRDADNAKMDVKSVTADKTDAKKLTLETFASLADGKTYTFAYTAPTEDKTASKFVLTATDGTVASVNVTPTTVPVNKKTALKYQTIDKSGVILSEEKVGEKASDIDITCTASDGYLDGSDLLLLSVGATAKVTVTYHTFKYDTTTTEEIGKVTGEFEIVATKDDTTISGYEYTVTNGKPNDWSKVTAKKQVALEDTTYNTAYFHVTNNKNEDITSTLDDYTVSSSDENVLIATGDVASGAVLTPVKVGQAFLVIKNGDNEVVQTLAISVVGKRVLSDLVLSKTTATIATDASAGLAQDIIKVTAKDQYGDKMLIDSLTSEYKNASTDEAKASKDNLSVTDTETGDVKVPSTITITTTAETKKGTYNYIVKAKKGDKEVTKAYNIVVKDYKGTESFAVVMTTATDDGRTAFAECDTTITEDTSAAGVTLYANLALKKNDVIGKAATLAANTVSCVGIKVVGPDSKVYVNTGYAVKTADIKTSAAIGKLEAERLGAGTATVLTMAAIEYSSSTFTKNMPAGTYTVTYTLRKQDTNGKAVTTPVQKTFTIKDTQPAVAAVVKKTTVDTSTLSTLFATPDYVTFTYGGKNLLDSDDNATWSYVRVDAADKVATGSKVVVKAVVIKVPVPAATGSTGKFIEVKVPVNKVFTGNAASWS